VLRSILLGERDKEFSVDILNSERRKTVGNRAVCERLHQGKAGVIHFHNSVPEIGGVNKVSPAHAGHG
jgi:hypothetical protein